MTRGEPYKLRVALVMKCIRMMCLALAVAVAAAAVPARAQHEYNPYQPHPPMLDGKEPAAEGLLRSADELWVRGTDLNRDPARQELAGAFLRKADETLAQIQREFPFWKREEVAARRKLVQNTMSPPGGHATPAPTPYVMPEWMIEQKKEYDAVPSATPGTNAYSGGGNYVLSDTEKQETVPAASGGGTMFFGALAVMAGIIAALVCAVLVWVRNVPGDDKRFDADYKGKGRGGRPRRARRRKEYDVKERNEYDY